MLAVGFSLGNDTTQQSGCGIIAVENDHIAAIGPAIEVMQQYSGAPVIDLGEVMLLPQAVNAHTHLELTLLAELGKQ